MTARARAWAALIVLAGLAGAGLAAWMAAAARAGNGVWGFPLDDPWIHLQFARNLVDHGAWSYFRDEMVVGGSTSPVFTLLLALGLSIGVDPILLCLGIGLAGLAAAAAVFGLVFSRLTGAAPWLGALAAALIALDPRLQWAAVSGMETTLFLLALALALHAWTTKRWVLTGLALGAAVWTRPEAILFAILLAAVEVWDRFVVEPRGRAFGRDLLRISTPFAALTLAYLAFNLALSGTVLPNTVGAKATYYHPDPARYLGEVAGFLLGGHLIVLAPFIFLGVGRVAVSLGRRRRDPLLLPLLFSLGMMTGYALRLPFLFQHGRYLMPTLPFVIFLGLGGLDMALRWAIARMNATPPMRVAAAAVSAALLLGATAFGAWEIREPYRGECSYIHHRQVAAAAWIREHTQPDAVIATHDVGALAFYSDRRIVDLVGLVSPEMISQIHRETALAERVAAAGATHVAVLPSWYTVVNAEPLFVAKPGVPDPMTVYALDKHLRFVPYEVRRLEEEAAAHWAAGRFDDAVTSLEAALTLAPDNARAHHHLSLALVAQGRGAAAFHHNSEALRLYPASTEIRVTRARLLNAGGRTEDAARILERLLQETPGDPDIELFLNQIRSSDLNPQYR